jgi:hypothetical protein
MFFGGGGPMGGGFGGPGVRMYSSGFGGMPRAQRRERGGQGGGQQQQQSSILQLLPILFFILISFFSFPEESSSGDSGSQYFSLTHKHPFTNPMETRHRGVVKDIPYFVSDKFMRTYYRDPYKVAQVERMVERAYDTYLVNECRNQRKYKRQLEQRANNYRGNQETRDGLLNEAVKFELTRCDEHRDLFQTTKR